MDSDNYYCANNSVAIAKPVDTSLAALRNQDQELARVTPDGKIILHPEYKHLRASLNMRDFSAQSRIAVMLFDMYHELAARIKELEGGLNVESR